eukprot:1158182-Pelagomonas_calceolata.AAC.2
MFVTEPYWLNTELVCLYTCCKPHAYSRVCVLCVCVCVSSALLHRGTSVLSNRVDAQVGLTYPLAPLLLSAVGGRGACTCCLLPPETGACRALHVFFGQRGFLACPLAPSLLPFLDCRGTCTCCLLPPETGACRALHLHGPVHCFLEVSLPFESGGADELRRLQAQHPLAACSLASVGNPVYIHVYICTYIGMRKIFGNSAQNMRRDMPAAGEREVSLLAHQQEPSLSTSSSDTIQMLCKASGHDVWASVASLATRLAEAHAWYSGCNACSNGIALHTACDVVVAFQNTCLILLLACAMTACACMHFSKDGSSLALDVVARVSVF